MALANGITIASWVQVGQGSVLLRARACAAVGSAGAQPAVRAGVVAQAEAVV